MRQHRTSTSRNQMPDILLITVDALNADYTSMYGAETDTTPFLRELADRSLVSQNHFANAQGTIGSLTSLLTGREPTDVRVIYSSDMLQATDAYQHLPGILSASATIPPNSVMRSMPMLTKRIFNPPSMKPTGVQPLTSY
jgi:arylsulfatase A-like enzyme